MKKKEHERLSSINTFCISCGSENVNVIQTHSDSGGVIAMLYYCHKQRRVFKVSSSDVKFMDDEGYGNDGDNQ